MYTGERLFKGENIQIKKEVLCISIPEVFVKVRSNRLKIRIDRNNDFYYKNSRAEKIVKSKYEKLINNFEDITENDIDLVKEKIEMFLHRCYSKDLIRSKSNMEAIYTNRNAGGPGFLTGSAAQT